MTKKRDICLPAVTSQPPSLLDILVYSVPFSSWFLSSFVVNDGDWAPERLFFDNSESPVQIPDLGCLSGAHFLNSADLFPCKINLAVSCWFMIAELQQMLLQLLQQHLELSPNFQLPSFVIPAEAGKGCLLMPRTSQQTSLKASG